jgi:hypothetical protein
MTDTPPSVQGIRVLTPANWIDLDLDPATSEASLAKLVDARVGGGRERAADRKQLTAWLQSATAQARDNGSVFASMLSDTVEGVPVSASLFASLAANDRPVVPGQTDSDRAGGLAAYLTASGAPLEGAMVRVVELPAGWAVRARRRTSVRLDGLNRVVEVENLQYFTLIPGSPTLLVLTFSTPVVSLADALVSLFDAIAETLKWETV